MNSRYTAAPALFLCTILLSGNAAAQDANPRRVDPGDPPAPDAGSAASWVFLTIPGQATGSSLGAVAVRPIDNSVFVWSTHEEDAPTFRKPKAAPTGDAPRIEPGDPGRGGDPEASNRPVTVSTLYQWFGGAWTARLVAKNETGAFMHVTREGDVYASTDLPDGSVRVYRVSNATAAVEVLPAEARGPAGPFAGDRAVFMRAGTAVLGRVQGAWRVEHACEEAPAGASIASLGHGMLVAPCTGHDHVFDGTSWSSHAKWLPVEAGTLWGGRDGAGRLHLFAGASAGLRIWKFVESEPGTFKGAFHLAFDAPATGGTAQSLVRTLWGGNLQEVYAAGDAGGAGRLYFYNGNGWVNAAPEMNLAAMRSVGGTPSGGLYVTLADGRLMHRPAVASAMAEPAVPAVTADSRLTITSAPGPQATLQFALAESRDVSIEFFDPSGRRVDALSPGRLPEGVHRLTWNAQNLASGVYFCRLEAGAHEATRKVLIRK